MDNLEGESQDWGPAQAVEVNAPRSGSAPAFLHTSAANPLGYGGYGASMSTGMYSSPYGPAFNTGVKQQPHPSNCCCMLPGVCKPFPLEAGTLNKAHSSRRA